MKQFAMTLISASLLLAGSSTWAEKIIGSVDQKGNVTFSDHVPAGAVKSREVKVDPVIPSQESQEATRETTQQMIDAADQSREDVENVRKAREELVEKRRSSMGADQQRSQKATVVPSGDSYVNDRDGYVTDQDLEEIIKAQQSEYVRDQGPGYVEEREPEYIQERQPKYIE
ncbi:MAG: DUF4124 domain-containing protein [Gammaproteobacteria bacterium]|nr:DUF4124 domain-containing protein [Gammaproteobacteria bacterium]